VGDLSLKKATYSFSCESDCFEEFKTLIAAAAVSVGIDGYGKPPANAVEMTKPKSRSKKATVTMDSPIADASAECVSEDSVQEILSVTVTLEDAQAALKQVNTKHGMEKAREILGSLGCARMSEVKPEQYTALVIACGNIK
jgi:hypothetical protein